MLIPYLLFVHNSFFFITTLASFSFLYQPPKTLTAVVVGSPRCSYNDADGFGVLSSYSIFSPSISLLLSHEHILFFLSILFDLRLKVTLTPSSPFPSLPSLLNYLTHNPSYHPNIHISYFTSFHLTSYEVTNFRWGSYKRRSYLAVSGEAMLLLVCSITCVLCMRYDDNVFQPGR